MKPRIAVLILCCSCLNMFCNKQTKQQQLEHLKQQQTELTNTIKDLEAQLAKETPQALSEKAKLVKIDTLRFTAFNHYIALPASITNEYTSYVTPRGQGGQVVQVLVKQGDVVKKGQLLLKLDNTIANQNVIAAKQSVQAIKTQLGLAKSLYERQKNLWNQGIGSEVQLLQVQTNKETLEANLKAQEENVQLAQEQANSNNVYATVSGVADEVTIRVGELFTGQPLAEHIKIVGNGPLKAIADIPENYTDKIKVGTPVHVFLPETKQNIVSKISWVSSTINANSRSFYVEVNIPNNYKIKPNQQVNVEILDYAASKSITIPLNTIQNGEEGKYVYVAVQKNGKLLAQKKYVTIGKIASDRLEILSGLNPNDWVISEGFQNLYDNQVITTTVQ